ncbi:MAG: hypothetical protein UT50_C0028G0001 [Candidatus Moranbacteria bacterium GW2011_GWA2_39_41]|nr:MAG: hypothetical protein UT50_C0028G0001 [Candidatus Moranbacteria bacterium GW2011_GWA2_39_41]
MTKNEGTIDRIVRATVGIALIVAAFKTPANGLTVLFYIVGVVSIITAITGFCAFYKVFAIDTIKK